MKNILLIRHGQSEWNKLNLFTGFKNVELSEQGIEEANKAGQNFKKLNLKFDLVFTSELKRAQETAKIILNNLDQWNDLNSQKKIWHISLEMNNYKASVWSGFSFDHETQLAYVLTGSYGGLMGWYRKEPNLESSIIAVDVLTGKIEWRFQFIEHDLWDLDVSFPPILSSINFLRNK